MLGTWVVAGDWTKSVTVMDGIKNVAGDGVNLLYAKGANISDDSMLIKNANVLGMEIDTDKKSPEELIDEAVAAARKQMWW